MTIQHTPTKDYTPIQPEAHSQALATLKRALFLISLPFGLLGFVLPIYGHEIGATAFQVGLFFSVFSLMRVLLRPTVGIGLDRYGRRPFLLAGLAGYALSMIAFAYADQIWIMILARTAQGIASAFLWLAANAIVADSTGGDQRGRTFGRTRQARTRGSILGVFIGFEVLSVLGMSRGWRLLFAGYGIAGLVALFLAWRSLPETVSLRRHKDRASITWSRPWVLLLLVTLVTAASWTMVSPIILIFLQDSLDVGIVELATAYLPAALVWAFLPGRLGMLADRFGRKPLMVLGMAVAAASSFFLPALTTVWGLALLRVLQALCHAAGDPAEQALVADMIGSEQRGRAYGLYALAEGLGAVAGPTIGGWLYESFSPTVPFYANGIVLAVCTAILWAFLQVPARAAD